MKSQHSWFRYTALLIPLLLGSTGAVAFPEIPFCPLGGPPGWWNRMTDNDRHYYPPPYYPPPVATPYWNRARPYPYTPQNYFYPLQPNR